MKEKRYRLELSESQLKLIAHCLEDCSRFASGQLELSFTTDKLQNTREVRDGLKELYPKVVPELFAEHGNTGTSYSWNGMQAPSKEQEAFIAATYYLYREIYHYFAVRDVDAPWSVYRSDTMRCRLSGAPIQITEL